MKFTLKTSIIIGILLIFLVRSFFSIKTYYESNEDLAKRLKFSNRLMQIVSSDKVEVKHSESQGMYCSAKKDIESHNILMKIPREYIVSSCIL